MNETKVLLNAYYEALHELLEAKKALCRPRIEQLLAEEIQKQGFSVADQERINAYRDAAEAFITERIETYNPVGVQYTYDPISPRESWEMEIQLSWYDSRREFEELVQTARQIVKSHPAGEHLPQLARELIRQKGAFPDQTIITGYEAKPGLRKLPDYLVARVIEEIISQKLSF